MDTGDILEDPTDLAFNESVFHWPEEDGRDAYMMRIWWRVIDGRHEAVGFEMHAPRWRRTPLTASLLRSVPLGALIEQERRKLASELRQYAEWLETDQESRALVVRQGANPDEEQQSVLEELDFLERPAARRRYDTEHWKLVAATYDKAWAAGSAPTREVAEQFGVTRSTAGKWVSICRKMGLLPPTQKTRARGNPLTGGADGVGTED